MKRTELLSALTIIKPFVKKNTTIPSLSNIYFRSSYIEAFNGIQGIRTSFDSGIECGVSGLSFYEVISTIVDDELFLSVKDDDVLVVRTEKSLYEFATSKIQSFFPEESGVEYREIPSSLMLGLSKCLHFSEKDITLEDKHGVALCGTTLYSTNGIGVSKFIMEDNTNMNHIVQNQFIKIISSCKDKVFIGNNDKAFFIKTDSFDAFTIFPDVELLDYDSIISQFYDDDLQFVQIPFSMKSAIINASSIAKKKQIKISSKDKILCVSFSDGGVSILDKIDVDLSADFMAEFDSDLLSKVVALSEEIAVTIVDETVVLVGRNFEKSFICLVANTL